MKNRKKLLAVSVLLVFVFTMIFAVACKKVDDGKNNGNVADRYDDESVYTDLSVRESTGTHGAVASANAYASKAGYDILKAGGNAFDAAVAVAFAIGVTEPYASGIGGGGVMTAYDAKTQQYHYYNFREFLSAASTLEAFQKAGLSSIPTTGIYSVGVPTEVAGLCAIVEDFGTKTLAEVIAPAIKLAAEGFTIKAGLANEIANGYDNFQLYDCDEAFNIYSDEDGIEALKEGDTLIQSNYAEVLKSIAENGAAGFYTGWVADAIVAASDANNGFITHDDLIYAMNNYPKKEQPLHTNVFGYDIYTSNTPSSGGVILIEALNAIEYYCQKNNTTLQQIGYNSPEYLHVINTAMQLGYADKRKYVADNDVSPLTGTQFVNVPLEGLANKEYAQQRWDAIYRENDVFIATSGYDWGGASRSDNYSGRYADDLSPFTFQTSGGATSAEAVDVDDSGTTSFSVADSEGNIVSFTQTLNHFWGSYIMPENCGFMLNDQCTSFTIKTPAQSVHYVAPYKQPVSHIMPTIILKDGKPFATLGSPGSMRIPAAVLQVALNMMEFGMDIQSAINADRTYNYAVSTADSNSMSGGATYLTHKLMYLETSQLDAATVNALKAKNYYIVEYKKTNLYFGGVQGIKFNYDNNGNFTSITGGADPRRDVNAVDY